jgi:hypothetical protein
MNIEQFYKKILINDILFSYITKMEAQNMNVKINNISISNDVEFEYNSTTTNEDIKLF